MSLPSGAAGVPPTPEIPEPFEPYTPPPRPPKFRSRRWLHVLLFLLTLGTTTLVGALHYLAFVEDFGRREVEIGWWVLLDGLWYSGTLLGILGAHEMGHYALCRRYNVDATLPYFLPAPILLTGTLGAVIKIREAFPTRTVLFDIGVAGPIAGFVVLLPALFYGLAMSTIVPEPTVTDGVVTIGEPLLFQWAIRAVLGVVPEGQTVNMHPMAFAAWFGMFATALNLLPFGQLDGGHLTYATLGRFSTPISVVTVGSAIAMTFMAPSWFFMTLMMVLMLIIFGPRHPRVIYEHEPLGPGRRLLAVIAFAILAICFTPVPIEPYDLIRKP